MQTHQQGILRSKRVRVSSQYILLLQPNNKQICEHTNSNGNMIHISSVSVKYVNCCRQLSGVSEWYGTVDILIN